MTFIFYIYVLKNLTNHNLMTQLRISALVGINELALCQSELIFFGCVFRGISHSLPLDFSSWLILISF